ncbi:MAG TPA: mechanosensitive ion channel protein MscS [Rhodospirillaceae bacterium]|nr:mechanosensitive ion channel protein MscS [Rhodospirillaceae bacterium]HAT35078.1 mechanosensitive ion channel protein MscS [Rhodospirillaceae bacterium]
MTKEIEEVGKWVDVITEFAVKYGFQILGALVFLLIGLKIASIIGKKVTKVAEGRNIDTTLSRFFGSLTKLLIIAILVIITLGNFGISIAPLIALAGASAFGATLAIQGPLSNYGAGLTIILTRPFKVGSTISVQGVSGVVENITLGFTYLVGEDGEQITIPNKEIVGQIIVDSHEYRIVETKICIGAEEDADKAIAVLKDAFSTLEGVETNPAPQAGVLDFSYGGIVLGIRCWVKSNSYFDARFKVNEACLGALRKANIRMMEAGPAAVAMPPLATDGPTSTVAPKS